jgi:AcrR family transcriptional regulator
MYRHGEPRSDPAGKVLDAACELFYKRGVAAVGVDAIVASAGVSKATLYRHYHSKGELVAACLRRGDEIWRAWLIEGIERRATDPAQQLLAIFDWLEEWFASPGFQGCAFLNVTAELEPGDPAHQLPQEHKQAVRKLIARLARKAGIGHPDRLANEFMVLIDGAIAQALIGRSPRPAAWAKRLAQLALDAHADG